MFIHCRHRYTQRWEAHLWDPDAIRQKTAGSSRTRGRQVWCLVVFHRGVCCTVRSHSVCLLMMLKGLCFPICCQTSPCLSRPNCPCSPLTPMCRYLRPPPNPHPVCAACRPTLVDTHQRQRQHALMTEQRSCIGAARATPM